MKPRTAGQIRAEFLHFFEQRQHLRSPSAPLIPVADPTLLFISAGMAPFKDFFLGDAKPPAVRMVSAQKCMRAGGKHNDLDNVGYTARHHTFFEMLGNFSFGDYFKAEAIAWAWEFLTQNMGLDAERLWVSVYQDDDESHDIWHRQIGVPTGRILRLGDEDNFWTMGDAGPCGPCTEIHYDHGPEHAGGLPGSGEEGDRWVEIWNLVFMQYERSTGGVQKDLPAPCVDTGMGLERLAAAVQGQVSNYSSDLFTGLLAAAAKQIGVKPGGDADASLRVIADHLRALCFMAADDIRPSNEGRGYVFRRILRRAARHGHKLGAEGAFLAGLSAEVVEQNADAYPELRQKSQVIADALRQEEEQFALTLGRGMVMLHRHLQQHPGESLPGELVFLLHDTYGFPVDMTADYAREQGLDWDQKGYEAEMAKQRQRARGASSFQAQRTEGIGAVAQTAFTGYKAWVGEGKILALWRDDQPVDSLGGGEQGCIALDTSPFYAEGGGQVGDAGAMVGDGWSAQVLDCTPEAGVHLHRVQMAEGSAAVGDAVQLQVDVRNRLATMRNHSATHLMHAALKEVLGEGVQQQGSHVGPQRLRFDFSHPKKVGSDEQQQIEDRVNACILANTQVQIQVMDKEAAFKVGAVALFGEKYGDQVRVLSMGEGWSVELCGGTHVERTGDIGLFQIVSESSVASGVRRIEALTGEAARLWHRTRQGFLADAAGILRCSVEDLSERTRALMQRTAASDKGGDAASGASHSRTLVCAGQEVLFVAGSRMQVKELRQVLREIESGSHPASAGGQTAIQVLAADDGEGSVAMMVNVPEPDRTGLGADEILRKLAELVGGKGGGKSDYATGGGGDASQLNSAWDVLAEWLQNSLK